MFLIMPTFYLVGTAFRRGGRFTFQNIVDLFQPNILAAYWISHPHVSLASALFGAFAGLAVAHGDRSGRPAWIRAAAMTFSGVASNFAGIPLAFAFIATLGRIGLATIILKTVFGFDIYRAGFNILSVLGPDAHLHVFPDPADDR